MANFIAIPRKHTEIGLKQTKKLQSSVLDCDILVYILVSCAAYLAGLESVPLPHCFLNNFYKFSEIIWALIVILSCIKMTFAIWCLSFYGGGKGRGLK